MSVFSKPQKNIQIIQTIQRKSSKSSQVGIIFYKLLYFVCRKKQVNVLNQSRRHVFISWLTFLLFLIESPTLTAGTKTESW